MRSRKLFLTLAALIALAVGSVALFAPALLLASKGVASATAEVWMREVGVLLIAAGVVSLLVRGEPDSPALRAVLLGNGLIQIGLFPIEIAAYQAGTIIALSGIVPNSLLHLVLGAGFAYHAFALRTAA